MQKVTKVNSSGITFDNGATLNSYHDQDCCESHYLSFTDLSLKDFDELEFDLSEDKFFNKIPEYGIELVPIRGWSVKIPGYASNNGYYSTDLQLVLTQDGKEKVFDITECQKDTEEY